MKRDRKEDKEEFTRWLAEMLSRQWHLGEPRLRELVIEAAHKADPKLGPLVRKALNQSRRK